MAGKSSIDLHIMRVVTYIAYLLLLAVGLTSAAPISVRLNEVTESSENVGLGDLQERSSEGTPVHAHKIHYVVDEST